MDRILGPAELEIVEDDETAGKVLTKRPLRA